MVATSKIFLSTDSATVLHWLRLPANSFKPFVSTRIQEIQDSVPDALTCFRFVQSNLNPTDALTKPLHASKLSSWLEGQQFLLKTEENWPKQPTELIHDKVLSTKELSKNNKNFLNVHRFNLIIDFENLTKRISSWRRLVRVVAWLKRFMSPQQYEQLNAAELERAKLCLFWVAQSYFRDPSQEKTKDKLNLEIFTDDQFKLLRIHGRLNNFFNSESVANPIALPWQSKITRLFAEFMHQFYRLQGYRVVLTNLREQGVYIIRGKNLLKSIASKCIRCRITGRNLLQQQMGHLPAIRFKTYCAPFSSVALDFFGPLKIKKTRNVVINGSCLVIVCNTTRVIHLEITETQSTNDFLLAWRRFINKRGVHPSHAYSDRGQTFVVSQKPLRDWISNWNKSIVRDTMASLSTTFEFSWDFNIPLASHMNGVVESLIRSCRKAFDCATDYHKRSYSYPEWESWLRNMPPSLMLRSK